jgi:hypothetical protein
MPCGALSVFSQDDERLKVWATGTKIKQIRVYNTVYQPHISVPVVEMQMLRFSAEYRKGASLTGL